MCRPIKTENELDCYIIKDLINLALETEDFKPSNPTEYIQLLLSIADCIKQESDKLVDLLISDVDDIANANDCCNNCGERLIVHTNIGQAIEYNGFPTSLEEYNKNCPNECEI